MSPRYGMMPNFVAACGSSLLIVLSSQPTLTHGNGSVGEGLFQLNVIQKLFLNINTTEDVIMTCHGKTRQAYLRWLEPEIGEPTQAQSENAFSH